MKSLLKLPLAAFCILLSIRVLVAQESENYMTSAGGGDTSVDIYENEDVAVSESVSDEEINSEGAYAEHESFDMSEAQEEQVAAEGDTGEEVASNDDDSMEDASDGEGEDMSGDDSGDDAGDDNGGDDGGD
jgi:hypothetical protein